MRGGRRPGGGGELADQLDIWQIVAEDLFDELAAADQRRREEVAEQLADRDRKTQLFGIDQPTPAGPNHTNLD